MRFRARERLRTGGEFDAVFKRGTRLEGRLFLLVAAPNRLRYDRLGLAVSRRVGKAVQRNRARRLVRESFRRMAPRADAGVDLVVVARAEIVRCGQAEVDRELREQLRRIRRRAEAAGPTPSSAR